MPAKASLTLQFSSRDPDCGGVKLWVPAGDVDPGEVVRVFLWGSAASDLEGYTLTQGANNLGTGTIENMPGQTEHRVFHLQGDRALQKFNWPIIRVSRVLAYGPLLRMNGDNPEVVANAGEDVTHLFQRSGARCLGHVYGVPDLMGSIQAWADRSPWCRVWEWTAPEEPDTDYTGDGCPPEDQREDQPPGTAWFFLMRWGILQGEFDLEVKPYLYNHAYVIETANRMTFGFGRERIGTQIATGPEGNSYYFDDGPKDGEVALGQKDGAIWVERIIPFGLYARNVAFGFTLKSPPRKYDGYFSLMLSTEDGGHPIPMSVDIFFDTPWMSLYDRQTPTYISYPQWYPEADHLRTKFIDGQWHNYVINLNQILGIVTLHIDGFPCPLFESSGLITTQMPFGLKFLPVAHTLKAALYSGDGQRSATLLHSAWIQAW